MMVRNKIVAVSYLNTVPFIYGIEHAVNLRADLLLSPPSGCAAAFNSGKADIALLPVAAIPQIKDAHIVTPYCLGTNGVVRTVVLMSNSPIDSVTDIYLDAHSLTSVQLTRVLCDEYWNIAPVWHDMVSYDVIEHSKPTDAFLLIGDKVFDYERRFEYTYDLATCWHKMTELPFVFAAWVARSGVAKQQIEALSSALKYGIDHIREAIDFYGHSGKPYAYHYLTENLNFILEDEKHKALSLFWAKGRRIDPPNNPG